MIGAASIELHENLEQHQNQNSVQNTMVSSKGEVHAVTKPQTTNSKVEEGNSSIG